MTISDAQINQFIERITADQSGLTQVDREIIQQMAVTISRQGQAIYKLIRQLQDQQLFINVAREAVVDSAVDKLPALLKRSAGADFDFEAARSHITAMNQQIAQANSLKEGLSAVLSFATFIARFI